MTSRHGDAWDSPGFLLWHATLRWQRAMVDALTPFGLTHVQFVLLASTWWLGEHGGPPRQRDLAEHAGSDPMMTSQVVRTLERKGLLTRDVDPEDRRAWRLRLTREGSALARRAVKAVEDADAAYFAGLSSEARAGFLAGLSELGGRLG
jgi:DNA-binding MarR family transcriptional regulator